MAFVHLIIEVVEYSKPRSTDHRLISPAFNIFDISLVSTYTHMHAYTHTQPQE